MCNLLRLDHKSRRREWEGRIKARWDTTTLVVGRMFSTTQIENNAAGYGLLTDLEFQRDQDGLHNRSPKLA